MICYGTWAPKTKKIDKQKKGPSLVHERDLRLEASLDHRPQEGHALRPPARAGTGADGGDEQGVVGGQARRRRAPQEPDGMLPAVTPLASPGHDCKEDGGKTRTYAR